MEASSDGCHVSAGRRKQRGRWCLSLVWSAPLSLCDITGVFVKKAAEVKDGFFTLHFALHFLYRLYSFNELMLVTINK